VILLAVAIFMTILQVVQPGTRLTSSIFLIGSEYRVFYSLKNLGWLAGGLAISGLTANTALDEYLRGWYQNSVRNETTDLCSSIVRPLGNGKFTLPIYLFAFVSGMFFNGNVGVYAVLVSWGSANLRAILVGIPLMLFLQSSLGSSRPIKNNSTWHPFRDNHGVSGHCFMGAVPFLTAAFLTANPYLKAALYLASMLTGISRINNDAHYFSQVLMGWWLAWLAVSSLRMIREKRSTILKEKHKTRQ
jgi:membrane-associated phospholipid phosphatase